MKYEYIGGSYREFRGRVFWGNKPVEINDKGTLAALERMQDFRRVEDAPAPQAAPVVAANACPKCGKALARQGAHFHIRACKG